MVWKHTSTSLLVLLVVVGGCHATLPQGFLGDWLGMPEFNELGPWGVNLNFTIRETNDDGTTWLMRDLFPKDGLGVSGFQDFYVDEDEASMHYCGCIRDFFTAPAPTSRAHYDITTQTDTKMMFCLRNTDKKCDTTWELTLLDNNTLHSEYKFPSPVKHLDVTYNRISSSVPRLSQEDKQKIQQQSNCRSEYSTCFSPPSATDEEKHQIFKRGGKVGCPYAGLKHFGVLKKGAEKTKAPYPVHPRSGETTKFCYIFNEVVDYKLAWTFDEVKEVVDVMIQVPVTDENTYAAFGIAQQWDSFPDAPGMSNSDIVMGWAANGCVVSLFSEKETGTPELSTTQTILNPSTSFEDGILTVSYTRPFVTGHYNITDSVIDQVIWSTGSVDMPDDGNCEAAKWHYHSNLRGRRMVKWSNGPATMDVSMAC